VRECVGSMSEDGANITVGIASFEVLSVAL
jgi:hypothetical protein